MHKADEILGNYEDYHQVALMTQPRKAIFFRINARRHLEEGNVEKALKDFKVAVTISVEEDYQHQLILLQEMYFTYLSLRKVLPEKFSVYTPIWN